MNVCKAGGYATAARLGVTRPQTFRNNIARISLPYREKAAAGEKLFGEVRRDRVYQKREGRGELPRGVPCAVSATLSMRAAIYAGVAIRPICRGQLRGRPGDRQRRCGTGVDFVQRYLAVNFSPRLKCCWLGFGRSEIGRCHGGSGTRGECGPSLRTPNKAQ